MATTRELRRRKEQAAAQLAADIAKPVAAHIEDLNGVLQIASTATLVGFLRSGVDARMMLAKQLCDRGLDMNGAWVGFAEAECLFVAAFPHAADGDHRVIA